MKLKEIKKRLDAIESNEAAMAEALGIENKYKFVDLTGSNWYRHGSTVHCGAMSFRTTNTAKIPGVFVIIVDFVAFIFDVKNEVGGE